MSGINAKIYKVKDYKLLFSQNSERTNTRTISLMLVLAKIHLLTKNYTTQISECHR